MNYEIFIEYENSLLKNMSQRLYDLFRNNNYTTTLLDNTLSFNQKENIIKNSNKKNIIISNKVNDNNSIEIVYSLRDTNEMALALNNTLSTNLTVSKYYQRRDTATTNLDYYKILKDIKNNESIIIFYPPSSIDNLSLANLVYQGVTNYLSEQNIYTVQSGDTIYSIARKFNITVADLKDANNLVNDNLSIGQKLFIKEATEEETPSIPSTNITYTVKSGDSLYAIARAYNTTVDKIKALNNLTSNNLSIGQKLLIPTTSTTSSNITYTVKSGDSLYAIARAYNTTVDKIKSLNNLTSNNLSIGQKLLIP